MGTRSVTTVYGQPNFEEPLIRLYRQFDGYPDGHGQALVDYLSNIQLVNGLTSYEMGTEQTTFANGMYCLAAQLVAYFKSGPGSFYIVPHDHSVEEFMYELCPTTTSQEKFKRILSAKSHLNLRVSHINGETLFNNTIENYYFFILGKFA